MNAILPHLVVQLPGLLILRQEHGKLKHLQETIAILRGELNGKLEVLSCHIQVIVGVLWVAVHVEASAFAPDFPALRDFVQTLNECCIGLCEPFCCSGPGVLKLNQGGPQSACSIMDLKGGLNHLFSLSKEAVPKFKHHCLKIDLPLRLHELLGLIHYLASPSNLPLHLEEFCILQERQTLLLLRYLNEASLNEFSGLRNIADLVFRPRGDEPDLPLKVFGTIKHCLHHILEGAPLLIHALVGLSCLDVYFPGKLTINVVEHRVEDVLHFGDGMVASLFNQAEVLEPERPIL
jgi:hypothetical protein